MASPAGMHTASTRLSCKDSFSSGEQAGHAMVFTKLSSPFRCICDVRRTPSVVSVASGSSEPERGVPAAQRARAFPPQSPDGRPGPLSRSAVPASRVVSVA